MFQLNLVLSAVVLQVLFLSEASSGRVQSATEVRGKDVSNWKALVKDLKDTLSSDIDPCTDFHSYVCRKYGEPEEDNDFTKMLTLEPYLNKGEKLNESEMKAKNYMHSCLHEANENLGKFTKKFNFEKSIGGWPAFDPNWKSENFNWQAAIAEFASYHIRLSIAVPFMKYAYDSRKKYLYLRVQAKRLLKGEEREVHLRNFAEKIGYPFDSVQVNSFLNERKVHLRNLLKTFGVLNVNAVLSDARQFEEKYWATQINTSWDAHTVKTNFSSLKAEVPELDWDKYIETKERRRLPDDFIVHLVKGDVLKRALRALSKMNPKVFANYLFCQLLLDYPYNEIQPNKEECWQRTYNNFRAVLSQTILNKFVSEDLKGKVVPLLKNYVDTLYKYLPPPESTSDTIKTKYLKEILEDYFASLTDDSVNKKYKDLIIDPNSYLFNRYSLQRHNSFEGVESSWKEKAQFAARLKEEITADFPYKITDVNTKLWTTVFSYFASYYSALHVYTIEQNCNYNISLSECFDDTEMGGNLFALQILTKSFNNWKGKNEGAIQADNYDLEKSGLNLKKALFIGFTQSLCEKPKYTVNLMFSKFKEFGDTFNCSARSPMNSGEKCDIDKF